MKRINSASLLQAVDELASRDETLAKILVIHGPPPLWEREPGFHTLIHIILEQQVSLASAQAAYNRLTIAVRVVTPDNFLKLNDEELLKIGFSRQKNRYGRELALAILGGSLDLPGMDHLEDDEARAELMKVKGIGAWTANIYLLMALGRPDIWPSGDLALLVAIQRAKGLFNRPTSEEGQSMSTAWQPWRAVAARLLWHYYLSEPAKRSHL